MLNTGKQNNISLARFNYKWAMIKLLTKVELTDSEFVFLVIGDVLTTKMFNVHYHFFKHENH